MAICYKCKSQFYGIECSSCGWEAEYSCWQCKSYVSPQIQTHCSQCGWYICDECDSCGCNEERPLSNEEKEGIWWEDSREATITRAEKILVLEGYHPEHAHDMLFGKKRRLSKKEVVLYLLNRQILISPDILAQIPDGVEEDTLVKFFPKLKPEVQA